MEGKFYIDGNDAYLRYGVCVEQYGYKALVQYPPIKKININDWPEEDGIEPDLFDLKLDTREFTIDFFTVDSDKLGNFYDLISDGSYHKYHFKELGKSFRLRLVSQQNIKKVRKLERFSLQFADDFPLYEYEYSDPVDTGITPTGYEIDAVDFSSYSMYVLQGTDESILKVPAVKKNLLVNLQHRNGAIYDGHEVKFQEKEVTIKLLLRSSDVKTFWHNYNALLYDLVRISGLEENGRIVESAKRIFYFEYTGEEYPCYYKSSSVSKFEIIPNRGVWCEFSIVLVFISFRIGPDDYLLATEDGALVTTEDGEFYIDMEVYGN